MSVTQTVLDVVSQRFPDAVVEVNDLGGDGQGVSVLVVSDVFRGVRLLAQHRMVMNTLEGHLKQDLHAVKITTMTVEQHRFDLGRREVS